MTGRGLIVLTLVALLVGTRTRRSSERTKREVRERAASARVITVKPGAKRGLLKAPKAVGVHRLEARACVENARGNGALRNVGAVREGVLREAFCKNGHHHDQYLWTILRHQWWSTVIATGVAVH